LLSGPLSPADALLLLSSSSPPLRQGGDSPGRFRTLALGLLPDSPEAAVPAGLVLETKSPVCSPTKKAYNPDFPK
jgi:hypothetical protein